MRNDFEVKDKHGQKIGSLEVRESWNFFPLLIVVATVAVGALTYFIWPIIYKLLLKQFETGKREYIITMSTTIGGIILGCIGSLVYTLRECMKGGPGKTGMTVTMMVGAQAAAIGGFATSFGITAIAFIILGITTGTFNIGEFLLLLLMLAVVSALLCILPAMITAMVAGLIVFVYDITGRIKKH